MADEDTGSLFGNLASRDTTATGEGSSMERGMRKAASVLGALINPAATFGGSVAEKIGGLATPTRKKVGNGHWGKGELKSAGGSQTVVPKSIMLQGDPCPEMCILDHKGEEMACSTPKKGAKCKMSKTQKTMTIGA